MAASRQAAILSLQQKREERRREGERIAQEEIALLQASGKIKRRGGEREKRRRKKEVVEDDEKVSQPKSRESLGPNSTPSPNKKSPLREAQSGSHVTQSPVQPTPPVVTTNTSTYADILDTLRLLEEAPPPLPGSNSKEFLPKPYSSAVVEVGVARHIGPTHSSTVGVARESGPAQSNLSESRLQSILSYLDEVERVDEGRGASTTGRIPTSHTVKPGGGGLGEELETVASDVTSTILSQRMEIDNKNKTVEMLQKALNQQRELTVYHAKEMDKEGERRLDLQRQEYETTIQRHQTFIDQLIEDKKKLGEKCEKLVRELRDTSSKYQTKVKTMEETHVAELEKVRQVAAATDKLRREKWRAEESRRIKEATVRSLEPEIQRIIQKGKTDIQRLKATQEAELLAADERAGRRFVAQMEELRAQCAAEKEQACAHERELARQRYEKLAEQEEMSSQQQRRRPVCRAGAREGEDGRPVGPPETPAGTTTDRVPGGPCQRGGRATERTLSSDGGGGETTRLPAEVSGGEAGNREGGVAGELHPETGDGFPRQREGDERETTTGERQGDRDGNQSSGEGGGGHQDTE
ncbi:Centrosomal protein of 131 kDa [Geodia barretti]|nr:Centrosomal protein of 131 kDa [Geodia barretti]